MFAQIGYYICVPFAWLTRLFYSLTGSYGLALILFTLVVKLVILPFQLKSKKSMLRMNRMQGKVKDIQTRFANNRERQQQEMADLYAREGVNPMSGCLWSFIPFPILIALYAIIRTPLRYFMSLSTSVIEEIGTLAGTLGYEASNNTYDQIYLAKFVHEHWADFAGKFGIAYQHNNPEYFGFCLRKGRTEMLDRLNKAIAEIKADGTENKLKVEWMGTAD